MHDEWAIEALSAAYDRKMSACSLGGMYDPEDEMIFGNGYPVRAEKRREPGITEERETENGQGGRIYELDCN